MNTSFQETLLKEATQIGEELCNIASKSTDSWSWQTLQVLPDNSREWAIRPGLYNGVAGIALFLAELGRVTGRRDFSEGADQALTSAIDMARPLEGHTYLSGREGVVWVANRLDELAGREGPNRPQYALLDGLAPSIQHKARLDDWFAGLAGLVPVLLQSHRLTGNPEYLALTDKLVAQLIADMRPDARGVYWERNPHRVRGMCGLAHGNGGIGLAFAEAARYLQNPHLAYFAQKAFAYEDTWYNEEWNNWPDLRNGAYSDAEMNRLKAAYRQGNLEPFTRAGYMNAWCHGAAGIGMARLRAYQITGNKQLLPSIHHALASVDAALFTPEAPPFNYSLCHGGGGNAELFLLAAEILKDSEEQYMAKAAKVARMALAQNKEQGFYTGGYAQAKDSHNNSLFMGRAGTGYFFLRLAAPDQVPSIMAPNLGQAPATPDLAPYPALRLDETGVKHHYMGRFYPRTQAVLYKQNRHYLPMLAPYALDNIRQDIAQVVEAATNGQPPKLQEALGEAFAHDSEALDLWEATPAINHVFVMHTAEAEAAEGLLAQPREIWSATPLLLNPAISVRITQWNWAETNPDLWKQNAIGEGQGQYFTLLYPTFDHVRQVALSAFEYNILALFSEQNTAQHALATLKEYMQGSAAEDLALMEQHFWTYTEKALISAVILVAQAHEQH